MIEKGHAAGGVLVDAQCRVLLREPTDHYDGYVWTCPMRRIDWGETSEQAAVREKTGYAAQIIQRIPGQFDCSTTTNEFYLMAPVGEPGEFDRKETQAVSWVSFEEAERRIGMTGNEKGRSRDLALLGVVRRMLEG